MIKHIVLYPEKNFGAQEVISSRYRQNFCEREIARDLTISVFSGYLILTLGSLEKLPGYPLRVLFPGLHY